MEGLALARSLTRAVPAPPARYAFGLATAQDDPEIRRMLRETVFPGSVKLSLEREPDACLAASVEGDVHDTIVARERGSAPLIAIASRSVRDRFVNGEPMRVGYLGQLRIDPKYRRQRRLMTAGFDFCRGLHRRGGARVYLASVVAGNEPARRLLERGLPGWPRFEAIDSLTTLAIPVRRIRQVRVDGVGIERATSIDGALLAACLRRNHRRYQFAPCWTAEDLASRKGLSNLDRDDFIVALRKGSIVGSVACWDQRAFKQVVVRGYSPLIARARSFVNAAGVLFGGVKLPRVGEALDFAYLSHLAVDEDDPGVLRALVSAACERANAVGRDYVVLGLSPRATLIQSLRKAFRHRTYESVLYGVSWPDGERVIDTLDNRPAHPELATL